MRQQERKWPVGPAVVIDGGGDSTGKSWLLRNVFRLSQPEAGLCIRLRQPEHIIYFSSAQIGCGQMPSTSVAMVSTAIQSLLIAGRTMALASAASLHHMARMTLK